MSGSDRMRQYWCDDLLETEWLDTLERDAERDGGVTPGVLARLVWSVRELRALLVAERETVRWMQQTGPMGPNQDPDAFDVRPDEDVVEAVQRQMRTITEAVTALWHTEPEPQRWVRLLTRAPWGMLARMVGPVQKILHERAMRSTYTQWLDLSPAELERHIHIDPKAAPPLDEEG
jgi:hypothetical protein